MEIKQTIYLPTFSFSIILMFGLLSAYIDKCNNCK